MAWKEWECDKCGKKYSEKDLERGQRIEDIECDKCGRSGKCFDEIGND